MEEVRRSHLQFLLLDNFLERGWLRQETREGEPDLYSSHSTDSQITSAASGSICKTIMFKDWHLDLDLATWYNWFMTYQLDSIFLESYCITYHWYQIYLQWGEAKLSILIITRDCRKSVITELPTNQKVWALRCSDSPLLDRVFDDEQELHQRDKLGKPTACPLHLHEFPKDHLVEGQQNGINLNNHAGSEGKDY